MEKDLRKTEEEEKWRKGQKQGEVEKITKVAVQQSENRSASLLQKRNERANKRVF